MTNWRFNGWAKYPNHKKDDAINDKLARRLELRQWQPTATVAGKPWRVVLEGGAIDVNGAGTLLSTEECLLDEVQARNPGLSREELERVLGEHLGARKVALARRRHRRRRHARSRRRSLPLRRRAHGRPGARRPTPPTPITRRCATTSSGSAA